MDNEMMYFEMISNAGEGRSCSMEAIALAKENKFEEAEKLIEEASEALERCHKSQTALIQSYAAGENVDTNVLLIHAQDHLMTSMVVRDLAREFIELYKRNNQ
ncbi:PTS lactose/cellobiose transporter subunit IIA [Clostridium oceanicum]|uniref:PTS lichenan transporter subunit IIA n=1 Tax=Clostridium oceanicum TaxID=1543 RepID=A0ABN1JRE3_9CLOT